MCCPPTSPNSTLALATQDDSHAWSSSHTYETSFTMCGATSVTLQPHQILRLPSKMTTQNLTEFSWRQLKRHLQRAADPRPWSENDPRMNPSVRNPPRKRGYFSRSGRAFCIEKYNVSRSGYPSKFYQVLRLPRKVTLELHQVLPLPRKVTLELHQVLRLPRKVTLELHQVLRLPRKVTLELHQVLTLPPKVTLELHHILPLPQYVTLELHQVLRLPQNVALELHQVLRLPHRMTRMLDPRHIWNVICNARSNKCHPPNSPNTAPATQDDSHAWSSTHMKRHLPCAEQQVLPSNLTKYCACHAKWPPKIWQKFAENSWNVISIAQPIWDQSENDPTMIQEWSENEPVSPQPAAQTRLLFALRTSILYWKIQRFALRLSFQVSPSTAPATISDTWTSPSTAPATKSDAWTSPSTAPATTSDTWTSLSTAPATQSDTWASPSTAPATKCDTWASPSTAPATKCDTWTSPSTAPATQNDSHVWSSSHMKLHLQCAQQHVTLQPHQILHLPRKMTRMLDPRHIWNVIYNARSNKCNLTKYCACHAK